MKVDGRPGPAPAQRAPAGQMGVERRGEHGAGGGSGPSRREVIALLGLVPLAGALEWTDAQVERAARAVAAAQGEPYVAKFFTPHEWATVRVLADLVIPRDERSGSATDAKVPEFMDFMMTEVSPESRLAMRGGLAWLDAESRQRFGTTFVGASAAQRTAVLDDIAWPARAPAELSHGVAFFNRFRDLTASGFWSSAMGFQDLAYQGNTFVREWNGCPEAALRKLGVSYDGEPQR